MASPAVTLPWAWILEALADFADTDLLQALLNSAPDIMGDSYAHARERISLRYLQEWLRLNFDDTKNELSIYARSSPGSRIAIDTAERSEDVLIKLAALSEQEKHGAELKYDIEQFISQKKANLPACILDQLADPTLYCCSPNEACCLDQLRNCKGRSDRSGSVKRVKLSANNDHIQLLVHSSAEQISGNYSEVLRCTGGGEAQDATFRSVLRRNEIGDQVLKAGSAEALHPSSMRPVSMFFVDEANCGDCCRPTVMNNDGKYFLSKQGSPAEISTYVKDFTGFGEQEMHGRAISEDGKQRNDNDSAQSPNQIAEVQPQGNAGAASQAAERERIFSALSQNPCQNICYGGIDEHGTSSSDKAANKGLNEKQKFLSHEFSISGTSWSEWTEQSSCIKCGKEGKLLTCCSTGCVLAVHEGCLGSFVTFEDSGDFFCPFCAYSRATAAYRKAKHEVALSRKALSAFIGRDFVEQHQSKDFILRGPTQQSEATPKVGLHDVVNDELCCTERGNNIGTVGKSHPRNVDRGLPAERHETSSLEEKSDHDEVHDHQDIDPCAVEDSVDSDMAINQRKSITSGRRCPRQQRKKGMENEVFEYTSNHGYASKHAIDGKRDTYSPMKQTRCHTRAKCYERQILQHARRNKLLWTADEEKILKEGVEKFSGYEGKGLPWRKILELGHHIFHNTRTPIDLKDKWRNMTRSANKQGRQSS